nr:MAG TPA: hypothetical protein [Caudoviricetes sp.]
MLRNLNITHCPKHLILTAVRDGCVPLLGLG